jgi:MFS family permease
MTQPPVTIFEPTPDDIPASPAVRRAHISITAVFVAHGLLFASWTAHIPHVKQHIGLTDAALGTALLGAPAGSITAMVLAGSLLPKLGSARMVQACLLGYGLTAPLVGVANSLLTLFLALFAWGIFHGALDVAMNTQAITVERARNKPLMSGLHGGWSIGSFAGAGLGALGVGLGLGLAAQLVILAIVMVVVVGWQSRGLLSDQEHQPHSTAGAASRRFSRGVVALGSVAFAAMLCEGAAADWAAVYLRDSLHATPAIAGLGFAAFSSTMVLIRLTGNALLTRYGARRLLPTLATITTLGFAAGLATNTIWGAMIAFAALGLGLGAVVPTVFSAAGRLPGMSPGIGVATVSAFGWGGFVLGPPLIGQLSSATSLTIALATLPFLTAYIAIATRINRPLHQPPGVTVRNT